MGGHDDGVGDGDGRVGEQHGDGGEVQPWPTSGDAGSFLPNHHSLTSTVMRCWQK